jgi:3-(3-hydroxy-phenyl)propionate hydroxylase
MADSSQLCDVAIVGAGPVGAVAANLCGVHGLSAIAFDSAPDVYDLPRAAALYDDAQRILDDAGVLEAILPSTCELVGAEFVDAAGARIVGFEVPPGLLTENGCPPLLNINQPEVERAIRSGLSRFDHVALAVSHEVIDFQQVDDHVELTVRDLAAGHTRQLRARWLLACDGARSTVRKAAGIGWKSLGYDCDWLVVDLALTRSVALTPFAQQICDPIRPVTIIPMPGVLRRWEFQLKPGETREEMEAPDRVWQLLAPWLSPRDGEILRAVVYRFHATIADRFRSGRVFLAGDAAHQTPPFMGQGLCTGIRDVENLIWKLALVRGGAAGDGLLDTYNAERRPLAAAMVEHSTNTGKLIDAYAAMARGGPEPPPELQEYAYGGTRTLPDLSAGLLASDGGRWVGQRFPQATVSAGGVSGRFDDIVGPRWAVVATEPLRGRLSDVTQRFLVAIGAVLVEVPRIEGYVLAVLLEFDVIVVRPDRIIYGAGALSDIDTMIAQLSSALRC